MALPKYLYLKIPNNPQNRESHVVVNFIMRTEDEDSYVVTARERPHVYINVVKNSLQIVGSGDEPYNSVALSPLSTIWITPGIALTDEESAVPNKIEQAQLPFTPP